MSAAILLALSAHGFAQTGAKKKVVRTEADLPRFDYPISGTATGLLQSDEATFHAFAARVQADVDSVLNNYDIQDRATLRHLLGVRLELQLLAGNNQAALETITKLRALQEKPAERLLTGLQSRAMIEAQKTTGQSSGPEYDKAYEKAYAAALKPLSWSVVGNLIKQEKSGAEITTPALVPGGVQASVEPAVAKSHQLSNDLAWRLIGDRVLLTRTLPLKAETVAVLAQEVAAHNVQKPDIWAAREVTLTKADKLTPVNVAIWDSGSDLPLFPGRVYTNPHPEPQTDPQDIAFDLKGFSTHGYLFPLDAQQQQEYPRVIGELKGFSDLQLSIESPEATALEKKLASMSAAEVPSLLSKLASSVTMRTARTWLELRRGAIPQSGSPSGGSRSTGITFLSPRARSSRTRRHGRSGVRELVPRQPHPRRQYELGRWAAGHRIRTREKRHGQGRGGPQSHGGKAIRHREYRAVQCYQERARYPVRLRGRQCEQQQQL